MTTDKNLFDIAIIGGGPIGMFTLFYAKLRDTKAILFESLPKLGGQVSTLYPYKNILDVAGFDSISGEQLIENLNQQLQQFNQLNIKTDSTVTNIKKNDNQFEITANGQKIFAKSVILAIGKGDFKPRKLQVSNIDQISKVSYLVRNPESYIDKAVAIAGGGDTALENALQISQFASKTYLIHRKDNYSALESTVNRVNDSKIEQLIETKINSLEEKQDSLIIETDTKNLKVDQLIVNYGMISDNQMLKNWDVDFEFEHGILKTNSKQQTNLDGIFAVGDISYYDGKAELIATGFGEALTAINSAIQHYQPQADGPVHSTVQNIIDGELND